MKPTSRIFALALSVFVLSVGNVPEAWAQEGHTDRYGSRKPACGCYVCGTLLTVSFEEKDCAGILAEDACGERLSNLPKEERQRFCRKIQTQGKFTSFKDSCPAYAQYCSPESIPSQDPSSGGASPTGPGGADPLGPVVKRASFDRPTVCDGKKKGTVKYTLTGPAAPGLKVTGHVDVQAPSGSVKSGDRTVTVPTGKSAGSFRMTLPGCQVTGPGERCSITGSVRVQGLGSSVSIAGSCSP